MGVSRRILAGVLLVALAVIAGIASFRVSNNAGAAPANDNLASAVDILLQPYTNYQSTIGAGTEAGETTVYSTCTGPNPSPTVGQTVWYKWTAPSAITILADTIGSDFDSTIAVYSGPASSPTFGSLTLVGCNDQFSANDAGLSFAATSGTTYYFQVGGYFANSGNAILNLGTAPATTGTVFTVNTTLTGADVFPGNGVCNDGLGNCTLQAAIDESNALAGVQFIRFAVGSGAITLTGGYTITGSVNIDARTQPGFLGVPLVSLSGPAGNGLVVNSTGVTIRGFVMNGFTGTNNSAIAISADGAVIQGNYIGTNAGGSAASANNIGISATSSNNTIGGITTAARNLISGNTVQGLYFSGGSGDRVSGNYVGTDIVGFTAIPNGGGTGRGALQLSGTDNSTIGGTIAGSGNLISGNSRYGVAISELGGGTPNAATGNTVQGNLIGTVVTGATALANTEGGIFIGGGVNNTVGGTGGANTIAYNGGPGVAVSLDGDPSHVSAAATGNNIRGNSIHDNAGAGIDLNADGVTANDAGDPDSGPNNLQNFPILTGSFVGGGATTVTGTLNSTASTSYTLEFFSITTCDATNGEGQTLLGSTNVLTDGSGNVTFNSGPLTAVTIGDKVTATATKQGASLDTSEFSACSTSCGDSDTDLVCDGSDNCPQWANPSQSLPPYPTTADDADCDGFRDTTSATNNAPETYIGTDPLKHCAATGTADDEGTPDAWAVDFNDNRLVNGQDVAKFSLAYNKAVGAGPFGGIPGVRFDFSGNGIINGQDIGKFSPFYNKTCA
jgi:hypothetical protein